MIPFYDATPSRFAKRKLRKIAGDVISKGTYVGGDFVSTFESDLGNYLGGVHAVGVGNGYDALALALMSLGVGPGDEVIVPSHTFMATWSAVNRVGGVVVAVDVDPQTGLVDLAQVVAKISAKTKAFIPVHLYGNPLDFRPISQALQERSIGIIEDCAQSIGARVGGQMTGTLGDIGAFSFYPTKNLGALGDGGACVTKDPVLAQRLASLRSYGFDGSHYKFKEIGVNSRLDTLQAAFLSEKLKFLENENQVRRIQAAKYAEVFAKFGLQSFEAESGSSVFHHFPVLIEEREKFRSALYARKVSSDCHYPYTIESFRELVNPGFCIVDDVDLLGAREIARKVTTFPIGSWMSSRIQSEVIGQISEVLRGESIR